MKKQIGNKILIELNQSPARGTPWRVSVYKKVLGFRRRISSDWFLNEHQATKFVDQIAKELGSDSSTHNLKQRKPGWTLHRPTH
ncbi:MAG TPA: hypothetical protein DGH68_07105 [Bacteroidetes bacterium]|jgi:hypothetical protein|nr:hypothetical protein [Bacteroidota bacterium]